MSLGNLRGEGLGQSGAIGGVDEYLAYIGLGGVLELDLMYSMTLRSTGSEGVLREARGLPFTSAPELESLTLLNLVKKQLVAIQYVFYYMCVIN